MKPIGKYIIIENNEDEIKTESGIILSGEEANQFRYKKACVVEPGSDVCLIKKGDIIYYDKSYAFTMLISDKPYTIIREQDVVVVE